MNSNGPVLLQEVECRARSSLAARDCFLNASRPPKPEIVGLAWSSSLDGGRLERLPRGIVRLDRPGGHWLLSLNRVLMSLRSAPGVAPLMRASLLSRYQLRAEADRYRTIQRFFQSQVVQPSSVAAIRSRTILRRNAAQRQFSSTPEGKGKAPLQDNEDQAPRSRHPQFTSNQHLHHAQDYPRFIRRILHRLPAPSNPLHRPTKEDLLGAATSFWQRLRIRFKWFTIRGWRRFNTDDFTAFFSWFLVGNTIWIIIGTTTFFSAVFATLNSLSLQSHVGRFLSDYLTSNTGCTVVFESAIVPRWGASTITFRNVFVSRRPQEDAEDDPPASSRSKAAIASFIPRRMRSASELSKTPAPATDESPEERRERLRHENNYTMFDINIEEVEVAFDLKRWLDGKGLVKDAKVRGVRGVIDRHAVFWDTSKPLDPADYRHESHRGDFELESLQVEDFLVTVYQPNDQKPFNVSLFNANLGPFRKRWLFYDLMSAQGITGQFDNCLFSLHKPQRLGKATSLGPESEFKQLARFRIDGLPIEHAQYATGFQGPMSWITSGKVDAVLDIKFPHHPDDDVDYGAIFEQIGRNVAEIAKEAGMSVEANEQAADAASAARAAAGDRGLIPGQHRLARPALRAPEADADALSPEEKQQRARQVEIDIDLRFRDLKAAVPLYTTDLNLRNNALIRPIVAFINANRTLIPIHCKVTAPLSNFDGSWTLFETGLTTSISAQIYSALTYHVSSYNANQQRIKTVGAWGVQRGAEAVLGVIKSVVDPMHGQAQAA